MNFGCRPRCRNLIWRRDEKIIFSICVESRKLIWRHFSSYYVYVCAKVISFRKKSPVTSRVTRAHKWAGIYLYRKGTREYLIFILRDFLQSSSFVGIIPNVCQMLVTWQYNIIYCMKKRAKYSNENEQIKFGGIWICILCVIKSMTRSQF